MTIPLHMIAEPTGDEIEALSDDERDVWHELRGRFFRAEVGSEFDPRHVLRMSAKKREGWRRRRLTWLRKVFADDPRVAA